MEFGVFIPGHWMDRSKPARQLYDEILAEACLAEELGFDTVWLAEHYLIDYIAIPDPFQIATAIIERTERIRVGVAVIILRDHHPLKLAAQIAQIGVMSGGRFVAALGCGSSGYEFCQFGLLMSPEDSRDHFHEHFMIMSKLWKSPTSQAHEGRFFSFDNATIVPPPVTPEPPFYLAGLSPFAIKLGVGHCIEAGIRPAIINSAFREPMAYKKERYDAFVEALDEHGIARADGRYAINGVAHIAESDDKAFEIMPTVIDLHRGLARLLDDSEIVENGVVRVDPVPGEPTPEEMFENCLIGGPETVRAKVQAYADLGIDHLSLYVHMGQPHEQVASSMKLFAREVMPAFRP